MGGPDTSLKVLQSVASIREDLEENEARPLVEGMVESGVDRADNADEV